MRHQAPFVVRGRDLGCGASARDVGRGPDGAGQPRASRSRFAELAAITGAVDAPVAVDCGGDLRVVGSIAGTITERTLGRQLCPELFLTSPLGDERWLSGTSVAHLYVPPHCDVLVLPARSARWNGAALLRYDEQPLLSRYDLAVLPLRHYAPQATNAFGSDRESRTRPRFELRPARAAQR